MDYDEFVEIPDFPGYYINRLGTVISYKYGYRKELKITPDHKGYLRVCLMKGDGKTYVRFIHRLLAELFIPNPDPEKFKLVRHLDYILMQKVIIFVLLMTLKKNLKIKTIG